MIRKIRKNNFYSRVRQYFPMPIEEYKDDRSLLDRAQITLIDWPEKIVKPRVGIIQDLGSNPSWTKHIRFCENNEIPFEIYSIHDFNWLQKGNEFDVIIGFTSCSSFDLNEIRDKFYILESKLNKICYPSRKHILLYENKILESELSKIHNFPFIPTFVSYDKKDALTLLNNLDFPVVSKIVPSSGSVGVERIKTKNQAKKIIKQAFSQNGRKIHIVYSRQKNYVYFQEFIPNDGYDIRVIVVGNMVFGFYRKAPKGDFRASGMHIEEMRDLPEEAIRIARSVNKIINSPLLAVDMVHGVDGKFYINEFSPICEMSTLNQLQVNGVSGAYIFDKEDNYKFMPCNFWVHELALKEFFQNHYFPKFSHFVA